MQKIEAESAESFIAAGVLPLVDSGILNKPNAMALLHMLSDRRLPFFQVFTLNGRIKCSMSNFQCEADDRLHKL